MNRIMLIGNLTRNPELLQAGDVSVCKMGIAVNRNFKNADGEREPDYFNIVVWREKGENCAKYLEKGKKVCVIGWLKTGQFETEEGEKRYTTEVVADEVEFLSPYEDKKEDDIEEIENIKKIIRQSDYKKKMVSKRR